MKTLTNSLLTLLIMGHCQTAFAAPTELVEVYEKSKETLNRVEAERRKVLGSLYDVNLKMKRMSREKSNLTDQLFRMQSSAEATAAKVAKLQNEIEKQKAQIRKRLRVMAKLSGAGFIAVIFSQTNAADLDFFLRNLKRVNADDIKLIAAYQQNVAKLKNERKILTKEIHNIISIEGRIKQQEILLVKEHTERSRIISELDERKKSELRRFLQMQTDPELRGLLRAGFFEAKGKLPWPMVGKLVRGFGPISDPEFNIQFSHKGWRLEGPERSFVTSVFGGVVAFRGFIPQYGETMIIDHGDHYYSVYAGLTELSKTIGANVKQSEKIARIEKNSLYFEIRHFSDSQNPSQWFEQTEVRDSLGKLYDVNKHTASAEEASR